MKQTIFSWLSLLLLCSLGCEREPLVPQLPEPILVEKVARLGGTPWVGFRLVQTSTPHPDYSGIYVSKTRLQLRNLTSDTIQEVAYLLEVFASEKRTAEQLRLRFASQESELAPGILTDSMEIDSWNQALLVADRVEVVLLDAEGFGVHNLAGNYNGEYAAFDAGDSLLRTGTAHGYVAADGATRLRFSGNEGTQVVDGFIRRDSTFVGTALNSELEAISGLSSPDTIPATLDGQDLSLDLRYQVTTNPDQFARLTFELTQQN